MTIKTKFATIDKEATIARLAKRGVTVSNWTKMARADGRDEVRFEVDDMEATRKSMFAWKGVVLWAGPVVYGSNVISVTGERRDFGVQVISGLIRKNGETASTKHSTRVRGFYTTTNGYTVGKSHDGVSVGFSHNDGDYCKKQVAKMFQIVTEAGFIAEMTGEYSFDVKGWAE